RDESGRPGAVFDAHRRYGCEDVPRSADRRYRTRQCAKPLRLRLGHPCLPGGLSRPAGTEGDAGRDAAPPAGAAAWRGPGYGLVGRDIVFVQTADRLGPALGLTLGAGAAAAVAGLVVALAAVGADLVGRLF